MDYQKIVIFGENECSFCGNEFKYTKSKWRCSETPDGLEEIKLRTEHPSCKSLKNKIDKMKQDLLNCEYELFCKKVDKIYS